MFRGMLLLMLLGGLAACSHDAGVSQASGGAASPAAGCVTPNWRLRWQAETAPVISKRDGQEVLDRYDSDSGENQKACP